LIKTWSYMAACPKAGGFKGTEKLTATINSANREGEMIAPS